jgi:LacI family transcriptional regulator
MAMGAYQAATELGLKIPDDLSLVGFDNQELIAANLLPGLTTVALPHYEMGAWAVKRLVEMLESDTPREPFGAPPTRLECPLIVRASVAAPRHS